MSYTLQSKSFTLHFSGVFSLLHLFTLHIPMSTCFLHGDNTSSWHHYLKQLSSIWCFQLHLRLKTMVRIPKEKLRHCHWLKSWLAAQGKDFLKSGLKFTSATPQEQQTSLLASVICAGMWYYQYQTVHGVIFSAGCNLLNICAFIQIPSLWKSELWNIRNVCH